MIDDAEYVRRWLNERLLAIVAERERLRGRENELRKLLAELDTPVAALSSDAGTASSVAEQAIAEARAKAQNSGRYTSRVSPVRDAVVKIVSEADGIDLGEIRERYAAMRIGALSSVSGTLSKMAATGIFRRVPGKNGRPTRYFLAKRAETAP
jgi:hypothetical protein